MTVPVTPIPASIVPFDPTVGVAVVASVMVTVFVAVMAFLALAPIVSEKWSKQLAATGRPSLETEAGDAD
ncbi:hypothetical protein [Natronobacterium gregoryi]|uniref:Uncharacterized protein n=2 Tax=Natronobacterium gregoryi TaxID=44930 RepID=L0AEQ9_NATGS|nr:hypothetical protein [Natronobacterium gregoryi]AFZ72326.1 hypothetical protein Natgr_1097 [Natronobacterium gregoryi SP2]ELY64214.1 hypothetical protein C490_14907 [Natronobacterium gregoryi SP2]PLK18310.1 hypothetical protein CYV19_18160 [Natronobacterium gregoryi SP2]SFJ72186.1 hypothetical protein SAMN05443661_16514 [Natronobacterium gregoryi]